MKHPLHHAVPFIIGILFGLHLSVIFASHNLSFSRRWAPMHPLHFHCCPVFFPGIQTHSSYPLRRLLLIFPLDLPSLQTSHHPSSPPIGDLCLPISTSVPQLACGLNVHPPLPTLTVYTASVPSILPPIRVVYASILVLWNSINPSSTIRALIYSGISFNSFPLSPE